MTLEPKIAKSLDEGLEILTSLIDNIKRKGNYSEESTCLFIDQAVLCFHEAKAAVTAYNAAPAETGVSDEQFRAIGFTGLARDYPRSDLAVLMFAAFNGVTPDKLPSPAWSYFPNEATAKAWDRVAAVAAPYVSPPAQDSALREALEAVAVRMHEDWLAKGGLNCTEVCAIVRGHALSAPSTELADAKAETWGQWERQQQDKERQS